MQEEIFGGGARVEKMTLQILLPPIVVNAKQDRSLMA